MAITDINISEQLQTDAPSIKYTGNEGPQNPQQQQEMQIAQQIWEALGPEQQAQFQSFQQFFTSGIWKQILQQMQADEAQGQGQGIASLGPRNMEQQMPMPRMGAEYGGRIGFKHGRDTELMKKAQFISQLLGISLDEAITRVTNESRGEFPRPELEPGSFARDKYQEPLRPSPLANMGRPVEDFREEQIGIESLRGQR